LKNFENTSAHTESNVAVHLSLGDLQKINILRLALYILSKTHLGGAIVHRAPEPIIEKLANAEGGASHRLAVRLDRSTVWLDYLETNKKNYKKGSILYHTAGARNYMLSLTLKPWFQKSKKKKSSSFQNHHENNKKIILFAKNNAIF
jgi:hypothetical protein